MKMRIENVAIGMEQVVLEKLELKWPHCQHFNYEHFMMFSQDQDSNRTKKNKKSLVAVVGNIMINDWDVDERIQANNFRKNWFRISNFSRYVHVKKNLFFDFCIVRSLTKKQKNPMSFWKTFLQKRHFFWTVEAKNRVGGFEASWVWKPRSVYFLGLFLPCWGCKRSDAETNL